MIYVTPFDPATKQPTGESTNSGFIDLDQVKATFGPEYNFESPRMVIYGPVVYSDYPFRIDSPRNTPYSRGTTTQGNKYL